MRNFQKELNKLFVLLYFFLVPAAYSSLTMLLFVACSFGLVFLNACHQHSLRARKKDFGRLFVLLIVIGIGLACSPYSMVNTMFCFAFLIIAYYSYYPLDNSDEMEYAISNWRRIDWFYFLGLIIIVYNLVQQLVVQGIELERFYIPCGAWDVNVGALPLFAFYCYCDSKKHKLWIPVAICTTYFSRGSRGSLLIFVLFVVIKIVKYFWNRHKTPIEEERKDSTAKTFIIIMSATIITIIFSFVWTFVISFGGVGSYHSGLNDDSNAVRFRANVFAVEEIFGSTDFIFFGYDNDIRTALGDIDNISNYQTFMGYRLVQSHNSVLNMFMKNGIVFAIMYLVLLSKLLSKYYHKDRIEYWLPYLIGAMLVHGMFITANLFSLLVAFDAIEESKLVRIGNEKLTSSFDLEDTDGES